MLVELALRSPPTNVLTLEDLQVIHREIGRLEQTVQGFLNLAASPVPKKRDCDLRIFVLCACELVRGSGRSGWRCHPCQFRRRRQSPGRPGTPPNGPRQLVFERHRPNAERRLIDVELTTAAGADARIVVADTGKGVPEDLVAPTLHAVPDDQGDRHRTWPESLPPDRRGPRRADCGRELARFGGRIHRHSPRPETGDRGQAAGDGKQERS